MELEKEEMMEMKEMETEMMESTEPKTAPDKRTRDRAHCWCRFRNSSHSAHWPGDKPSEVAANGPGRKTTPER